MVPKPDLVIVLNAPPEVLQARKQEVSFEETVRQCRAYVSLGRALVNGHIVEANQIFERVAGDVTDLILRHLAVRTARRFGLE